MRQADPRFDFTPEGRARFDAAVEREKAFIRANGYVEFHDDSGRYQRIYVRGREPRSSGGSCLKSR